jgi:hypothetical protein
MSEIKYTAPVVLPTPVTPAAPANSIQYNNAGAFGGMANVSADAGNLKFAPIDQPSAPTGAGGAGVIYASNDEGDTQLTYINNYNRVTPLQYGFSHKILTQILPGNGATPLGSGSMFGSTSIILTGSADSNGTAKVNSVFTTLPNLTRQTITSAAALNSGAEIAKTDPKKAAIVGNGFNTQAWGTKLVITFGLPTYAISQRLFAGYSQYAAATAYNTDPSNLLNIAAVTKDAGEATFQFFFNDGIGAGVKIDTGITPTINSVYRVTVFIPSAGNTISINVSEITVGAITGNTSYTQTLTNIPASGTFLYPHLYASTAGSATAVAISLINIYEEQI